MQKQFGVQKEAVQNLALIQRGAIPAGYSEVARHNRLIDRYPTITGYYYQTFDTKTNVAVRTSWTTAGRSLRRRRGDLVASQRLQGYWLLTLRASRSRRFLRTSRGDSHTPYSIKSVVNARSCVGCHADGLKPIADVISRRIRERKVALDSFDKAKANELEELFLSRLTESLERDRRQYAEALSRHASVAGRVRSILHDSGL